MGPTGRSPNKSWGYWLAVLALLASPLSASGAGMAQTQFAMFYHPPTDGTPITSLSTEAKALIFTNGDEAYLNQMRAYGFNGPALEYFMANEASGPANLENASSPCGPYLFYPNNLAGVAGDFCTALHPVESNFLHNSAGRRLYSTQSWTDGAGPHTVYIYLMNPAAAGWQAYVGLHLADLMARSPYTGVFLDNLDLAPTRGQQRETDSDGTIEEYSSGSAYEASIESYLTAIRLAIPQELSLWANMTEGGNAVDAWDAYLPYLNGVMDEAFGTRWNRANDSDAWLAQVQRMERVLAEGKSFLGVGQGSQTDTQRQRFALASYLLAANENAFFRYANDANYYDAWWYSNYAVNLGAPIGPSYQAGGGVWQRDFACGKVTVDPKAHVGMIDANHSQPGCS